MDRLINIALRGSTLASKFILIFVLAHYLQPEEVGLYGLVVASVSYVLYFLGLDFYTFSTRNLLQNKKDVWGQLLKSQIVFFCCTYFVILPATLLLFFLNLLPWSLAIWFIPLLITEHLGQELTRLLIVVSRQLTASLLIFIRTGVWGLSIPIVFWLFPNTRTIETVLILWVCAGFAAALLGGWSCYKIRMRGWKLPVDWHWIRKGVKIAVPLLLGTLALRGLYTIDRFWFEKLVSREILGAYVLYLSFCNALMSFLDAGVFMYSYPKLIKLKNNNQLAEFKLEVKKLWFYVSVICLLFSGLFYFILPVFTGYLNSSVYKENQILFWWLLLATVIYAYSMIPHYVLYSKGQDQPIVKSHLLGLMIFSLIVTFLSKYDSYLSVPIGLVFSFVCVFLIKFYAYRKNSNF